MIYEITLIIQDYCRDLKSSHSEMTESKVKSVSILQQQHELELERLRIEEEQNREMLRVKIQQEVERKQAVIQENKRKMSLSTSSSGIEGGPSASSSGMEKSKIVPTISKCTILPFTLPTLDDCEQLVSFDNKNLYILKTVLDTSLNAQEILNWKTFAYPINSPKILDIISEDNATKILLANYKYIKLSDNIQLGEKVSFKTASSVVNGLLSVLESYGSNSSFLKITLDHIYFDYEMNPVVDYFPLIPSPTALNTCLNHVGTLLLQMLSKELSNPLATATKLGNFNPELGEFIKLLLDPQDLTLKDFQLHPFFATFALPSTPPSIIIPIPPPVSTLDSQSRYQTDFEELEFLGKGGFGHVLKSRNLIDGRTYAIKKIRLNPHDTDSSRRLITEVQTLSRVQSEYVVRYYQAWFETGQGDDFGSSEEELTVSSYDSEEDTDDWFSSSNNPRMVLRDLTPSVPLNSGNYTQVLYIQMEYCENHTLRNAIDAGLEVDQSWKFFRQLLEGLGHLHHLGVIHRDLKPSNVFLDNNLNVKLGDFGLATAKKDASRSNLSVFDSVKGLHSAENSLTSEIGTPVYIAPEIAGKGRYNSKVDMYSLGIVFFEMIYRMETGMQRALCLHELRNPDIIFPADFKHEVLVDQEKIIRMLLKHTPKDRPSCSELLQSNLVPANVEGEYINQELIRTVQQRNPTYYGRLVQALFLQQTDIHKDYAYDYNSNSMFDPLYSLVSSHVHFHARKVFGKHAALHISTPILIPKSQLAVDCYPLKKPAELLDSNGDVVLLPFDLTVPFARSLAQSSEDLLPLFPLKRFCIDKSYRKNTVGGQPRFVAEADFDIIYDYENDSLVPEAETIKVVFEVIILSYNRS
jgi:serine/threonine protein kinase